MKRLYARFVLWLIRPALEEKSRRESEQWKADEPRRRAAVEALDQSLAHSIREIVKGAGWRLSDDGRWECRPESTDDSTS